MKRLYYRIKWNIWAYWKYRRIVGKMRPWDYGYILRMMEFQLGLLHDHIRDFGYHVGEDVRLEEIMAVRTHLARLIKDNYYIETDDVDEAIKNEIKDWNFVFDYMRDNMHGWWN